jgi:hypothetical protein
MVKVPSKSHALYVKPQYDPEFFSHHCLLGFRGRNEFNGCIKATAAGRLFSVLHP